MYVYSTYLMISSLHIRVDDVHVLLSAVHLRAVRAVAVLQLDRVLDVRVKKYLHENLVVLLRRLKETAHHVFSKRPQLLKTYVQQTS